MATELTRPELGSREDNDYYNHFAKNNRIYKRVASETKGLSIGGKVTEVALNSSTWTALPSAPLTNRNSIAIQNRTLYQIKINYDNNVSGYVGMVIDSGEDRFYDITEDIIIYAKSESGSTPTVFVEELS